MRGHDRCEGPRRGGGAQVRDGQADRPGTHGPDAGDLHAPRGRKRPAVPFRGQPFREIGPAGQFGPFRKAGRDGLRRPVFPCGRCNHFGGIGCGAIRRRRHDDPTPGTDPARGRGRFLLRPADRWACRDRDHRARLPGCGDPSVPVHQCRVHRAGRYPPFGHDRRHRGGSSDREHDGHLCREHLFG